METNDLNENKSYNTLFSQLIESKNENNTDCLTIKDKFKGNMQLPCESVKLCDNLYIFGSLYITKEIETLPKKLVVYRDLWLNNQIKVLPKDLIVYDRIIFSNISDLTDTGMYYFFDMFGDARERIQYSIVLDRVIYNDCSYSSSIQFGKYIHNKYKRVGSPERIKFDEQIRIMTKLKNDYISELRNKHKI